MVKELKASAEILMAARNKRKDLACREEAKATNNGKYRPVTVGETKRKGIGDAPETWPPAYVFMHPLSIPYGPAPLRVRRKGRNAGCRLTRIGRSG
jgi:hypothetical protein